MFTKSRSKNLREQAQGLAGDLTGAIAPHVENARDTLAPKIAGARDNLGPRISEARDNLGPMLADARDKAAPYVSDARDKAAPYVADARAKVREDYLPLAQSALAELRENAGPVTEEAKRRGLAAAAALKGEDPAPRKRSKLKFVVLAGLLGAAAVAFKKLTGGDKSTSWQSSYTPPSPQKTAQKTAQRTAPTPASQDKGGSTPGEAISDAQKSPHAVTTPDEPAEVVELDEARETE